MWAFLYADSYVDLVVLDVQNIDNIHEVGRITDILPYTVHKAGTGTDYPVGPVDKEKGVVIDWELRTIKEKINSNNNPYPIFWNKSTTFIAMVNSSGASSGVSCSGVRIGESMVYTSTIIQM